MTKAYRILNWKALFEVTAKGKKATVDTPDAELRKSALPYLRRVVKGHSLSPTDRKLNKLAWLVGIMMEAACRDVYWELCDLAAAQDDPKYRGWVLDEKQRPINAPQIAELLDWKDDGTFQKLLDILCHEEINWVRLEDFPHAPRTAGERMGESGREGGEGGKVEEPLYNETEAVEATASLNNETERGSPGFPDEVGREGEGSGCVSAAPASALVSGSVSEIPVSGSDSAPRRGQRTVEEIKRESAKIILQITELRRMRPKTQGDYTTYNDIFVQLRNREIYYTDEPLFEMALKKAKDCCRIGDKPIAVFVEAMKKSPFCYVPVSRPVIKGKFDEYRKS